MRKIEPVITEKHHFDKRGDTFFNKFLEVLDYQHFDSMTKIIGFQINLCFIGLGFSIETLLEENKPEAKEESLIEF